MCDSCHGKDGNRGLLATYYLLALNSKEAPSCGWQIRLKAVHTIHSANIDWRVKPSWLSRPLSNRARKEICMHVLKSQARKEKDKK